MVTVRDQDGNPMENVTKSGGGTLSASESTTNGDGQASVSYTAGASTGSAMIMAEVPVLGAAVIFSVSVQ